tara:strand:+ start:7337 stop:7699 length:363 start_codon:yes stop_codon:yes gene_type:complete
MKLDLKKILKNIEKNEIKVFSDLQLSKEAIDEINKLLDITEKKINKTDIKKSIKSNFPKYIGEVLLRKDNTIKEILEYIAKQILELTGFHIKDEKKKRIMKKHVDLIIKNDIELKELVNN